MGVKVIEGGSDDSERKTSAFQNQGMLRIKGLTDNLAGHFDVHLERGVIGKN